MDENINTQNQTPMQPPATPNVTQNPLEQFSQPAQQPITPPQQTVSTPVNPQPFQNFSPQAPQQPIAPSNNKSGKNTKILFLGVGILILLVIIGALYVFALKNTSPTVKTTNTVLPQARTVPVPSVTPTQTDEEALQNIDTGDPSQDLQTINSDVIQL